MYRGMEGKREERRNKLKRNGCLNFVCDVPLDDRKTSFPQNARA